MQWLNSSFQATDERKKHVLVADQRPGVTQGLGDALELAGERRDREVTLDEIVKLSLGKDNTLKTVVEEDVGYDRPCTFNGVGGLDDDLEGVLGDGGVQPRHDTLIDLCSLDVLDHHLSIDATINMIRETKFLERDGEVCLPDQKIGLVEIEDHRLAKKKRNRGSPVQENGC